MAYQTATGNDRNNQKITVSIGDTVKFGRKVQTATIVKITFFSGKYYLHLENKNGFTLEFQEEGQTTTQRSLDLVWLP